jgi:electron transport complex protein RnfC
MRGIFMKRLHGVRLAHRKNTEQIASVPLPLPKLVRIPMSMHIGAPCAPVVKPKDSVLVGQKIGDTDAFMAAPIHSGVSGTVKAITTYRMSNGRTCPMVEIETDGQQTVSPEIKPPEITDKASFLAAIRESGLVGMGGASFPTHVKLAPKQPVDTLCINAAECEPYITSDYRQMVEAPEEVIDGILQVLHWLGIPKAIVGIESNKPKAIQVLTALCDPHPEIQVVTLPTTYPQGAEKVLIYNTLGRVVQEGQLPADQGVIVMNVSSVAFVSRYLKTGMPMVQRMVTVDGDAVGNPCNVIVPMGTPVEDVLSFAQWDKDRARKLLYGGPMMGIAISDPADPILKANNAILALEKIEQPQASPCIHCGRCVNACPLRLMPTEISKAFRLNDAAALGALKVTLCMNCGCCTYACPAKRPVAENNQLAKGFYLNSIK